MIATIARDYKEKKAIIARNFLSHSIRMIIPHQYHNHRDSIILPDAAQELGDVEGLIVGRLDEGLAVITAVGRALRGGLDGALVGRADGFAVGLRVGSGVGQSRLFVAVLRNATGDTPGAPAEEPRTHKTRSQFANAKSPMVFTVVGTFTTRVSEQLKKEEFLMVVTVLGTVITWNRLQSNSAG